MQVCCAETGGAETLFADTWLGVPVSTGNEAGASQIPKEQRPRTDGDARSTNGGRADWRYRCRPRLEHTARKRGSPMDNQFIFDSSGNEAGGGELSFRFAGARGHPRSQRAGIFMLSLRRSPKHDCSSSEVLTQSSRKKGHQFTAKRSNAPVRSECCRSRDQRPPGRGSPARLRC
jgi:hypothetical protein